MPSLPLPLLAAAENFLALAASGYYNDCKFHRNIKAFMVQVRASYSCSDVWCS